jgi:DNA (cytosine-5)-methyltransferase 1
MKAVDLFAGAGGFTLGATMAGLDVVWAANHWDFAIAAHSINHPAVEHVCQDLDQYDFTSLPAYDILLASPSCKGHSTASRANRRPYHDGHRNTAWAVIECMEATRPKAIIVENVPEFQRWSKFKHWYACIADDYFVQLVELNAVNHGVPQRRTRVFVVATRKGVNLWFPEAMKEPAIGPHLELDMGEWRHVNEAQPGAALRIERGRKNCGRNFLTQHVTGHPGVPFHEPIRTVTSKDQWAVVVGNQYRSLTVRETARAMGFPDGFLWPDGATRTDCIAGLGNAVPPPMARDIVQRVAEAA